MAAVRIWGGKVALVTGRTLAAMAATLSSVITAAEAGSTSRNSVVVSSSARPSAPKATASGGPPTDTVRRVFESRAMMVMVLVG